MKIFPGLKKNLKRLLKIGDVIYVENLYDNIFCLKTITFRLMVEL